MLDIPSIVPARDVRAAILVAPTPQLEAPTIPVRGWTLPFRKEPGARVRPVSTADGERIQSFVRALSLESRRARFFSPVRELSHAQLERMTQMAFPAAVGLVAERADATGELLAVAQYACDEEGPEFAVVVADAWQGRGLGGRLVRQLVEIAGVAGFAMLRGFVLGSNAAMIGLARSMGFRVAADRDPRLVRIVKSLRRMGAG